MKKIGKAVTNRTIRPQTDCTIKAMFVDMHVVSVFNNETGKEAKVLKAGGSYTVFGGEILPKSSIMYCQVNRELVDNAFCSWTLRIITPIENDEPQNLQIRVEPFVDIHVSELTHSVRIMLGEGTWSRWI